MAIDTKSWRLFIGCRSRVLAVLDANSGRVVQTLPIGDRVDAAAYDPATSLIYESCSPDPLRLSEGTAEAVVTVIHQDSPDKYRVVQTIRTQIGANKMGYDPRTQRLFLSVVDYGPAPEASPGKPQQKPSVIAGSFKVLVAGPAAP